MGKQQFRFQKFFACDLFTPQGVSGRKFVRGGICTLRSDDSRRKDEIAVCPQKRFPVLIPFIFKKYLMNGDGTCAIMKIVALFSVKSKCQVQLISISENLIVQSIPFGAIGEFRDNRIRYKVPQVMYYLCQDCNTRTYFEIEESFYAHSKRLVAAISLKFCMATTTCKYIRKLHT